MKNTSNILVYGYGNPGREDDGLGNAMIEMLEQWKTEQSLTSLYLDANYQLNIEDATEMQGKDLVIFVDASIDETVEQYKLVPVKPSPKVEFTMHATSPGFIMHLCEQIYGYTPPTWIMHIKGYSWNMKEALTPEARKNLQLAYQYIEQVVLQPSILFKENTYQM